MPTASEPAFVDEPAEVPSNLSGRRVNLFTKMSFSTKLSSWTTRNLSSSATSTRGRTSPLASRSGLFCLLEQWLVFQQLEIDHVIGESHKELMSNSSGPAAIIRIFGVTKAVVQFVRGNHFLHNIAKLSCCRPPSYCGFKYKNATFWEIPKSGLAAPDSNCTTWRNYEERRPGESIF